MAQRSSSILASEQAWHNFVTAIASQASKKVYSSNMKRYMQSEGIERCDKLLKRENKIIEQGLIDYFTATLDGTSTATKRTAFAAIKLFYTQNDSVLNWKKLSKYTRGKPSNDDKAYTKDQIDKILKLADRRLKVAVLLMSSAGLRKAGLLELRMKDLHKIAEYSIYAIEVYSSDKKAKYTALCSSECAEIIDDYMAYRKEHGEEITPESPVIRDDFDAEIPDKAKKAKRITIEGFDSVLKRLVVAAGIRKPEVMLESQKAGSIRHEIKLAHGFRKYFFTGLVRARVEPIYREMLMGHKTAGQGTGVSNLMLFYDKPADAEIVQEYLKAIPQLTISKVVQLQTQVTELTSFKQNVEVEIKKRVEAEIQSRITEALQVALQPYIEKLYREGKLKTVPA